MISWKRDPRPGRVWRLFSHVNGKQWKNTSDDLAHMVLKANIQGKWETWIIHSQMLHVTGTYIYLHYAKQTSTKYRQIYCWWTKSCSSWYGKYPIVYRFYTSQVVQDFVHQQCHKKNMDPPGWKLTTDIFFVRNSLHSQPSECWTGASLGSALQVGFLEGKHIPCERMSRCKIGSLVIGSMG